MCVWLKISANSREANIRSPGMFRKREHISLPVFKPQEKVSIILLLIFGWYI